MKMKKLLAAALAAAIAATTAAVPVLADEYEADISADEGVELAAEDYSFEDNVQLNCTYTRDFKTTPYPVPSPWPPTDWDSFWENGAIEASQTKTGNILTEMKTRGNYSFQTLEELFGFLATGTLEIPANGDKGPNKYTIDKEAPITITIAGHWDGNAYSEISETINKKIILTNSAVDSAAVAQADDALTIDNTSDEGITIEYKTTHSGTTDGAAEQSAYEEHSITFSGGMEIQNGAKLNIVPAPGNYGCVTARLNCIFNSDLVVKEGGKLDLQGFAFSQRANAKQETDFNQSTIFEFNDSSMSIENGGEAVLDGTEVKGENMTDDKPVIDNKGSLTVKKSNDGTVTLTKGATSAVSTDNTTNPAVKCEGENVSITITGGSTVHNGAPDRHADAVDLAPGTKVKTEAGTTVIGEEPVGAKDGAYIDNNGNLILPHGGKKTPTGSEEEEDIPPKSLETPDGTVYTAPEGEEFAPEKIASSIGLYFVKQSGSKYDIVLRAVSGDINKFNSAQFTFANAGDVDYVITPNAEENIALIDNGNGSYEFNFNGKDGMGDGDRPDTAPEIKLGTVEFTGYGKVDFSVNEDPALPNQAHATTTNDSLVTDFTDENDLLIVNGDNITVGEDTYLGKIADTIAPETVPLTIDVIFPNTVDPQAAGYTNMTVSLHSALDDKHNIDDIKLGSDKSELGVTYEAAGAENPYAKYTTEADVLTDTRYTLTFKGGGYRTYSVDVVIPKDAVSAAVEVWNNAMDEAKRTVVTYKSEAEGESKLLKSATDGTTFLAGDIDDSKLVDIYDLSAAVAYFGKTDMDSKITGEGAEATYTDADYIRYDLNRDGNIDSKDIAMVLVSWGK